MNFLKSSYNVHFFNKNKECHTNKKYQWHKSEPEEVVKIQLPPKRDKNPEDVIVWGG
jgi:hypothetical protein